MSDQEKTELREKGEKELQRIEKELEKALEKKDYRIAEMWTHQFSGSVCMLCAINLMTFEELQARDRKVYVHYMAARFPGRFQEETV